MGYSIWQGKERLEQGELGVTQFLHMLEERIEEFDTIIYENYALRKSSAKAMIGSEFETPQVIGVIKWFAYKAGVKLVKQSPAQKKFFGDDRLKMLGFYDRGQRHSRDSVRHALYYQFFTANIREVDELNG
ncbi:MAG: hypothetical protein QMD71_06370 [bacterium]|nr:hypothetical protein [bacterium]